jgi:hypothetical protein
MSKAYQRENKTENNSLTSKISPYYARIREACYAHPELYDFVDDELIVGIIAQTQMLACCKRRDTREAVARFILFLLQMIHFSWCEPGWMWQTFPQLIKKKGFYHWKRDTWRTVRRFLAKQNTEEEEADKWKADAWFKEELREVSTRDVAMHFWLDQEFVTSAVERFIESKGEEAKEKAEAEKAKRRRNLKSVTPSNPLALETEAREQGVTRGNSTACYEGNQPQGGGEFGPIPGVDSPLSSMHQTTSHETTASTHNNNPHCEREGGALALSAHASVNSPVAVGEDEDVERLIDYEVQALGPRSERTRRTERERKAARELLDDGIPANALKRYFNYMRESGFQYPSWHSATKTIDGWWADYRKTQAALNLGGHSASGYVDQSDEYRDQCREEAEADREAQGREAEIADWQFRRKNLADFQCDRTDESWESMSDEDWLALHEIAAGDYNIEQMKMLFASYYDDPPAGHVGWAIVKEEFDSWPTSEAEQESVTLDQESLNVADVAVETVCEVLPVLDDQEAVYQVQSTELALIPVAEIQPTQEQLAALEAAEVERQAERTRREEAAAEERRRQNDFECAEIRQKVQENKAKHLAERRGRYGGGAVANV